MDVVVADAGAYAVVLSLEMTNRVARPERRRVTPKEKAETQRLALVAEIKEALRTVAGVRTNELAYQLASQIANLKLWNKLQPPQSRVSETLVSATHAG